MDLGIIWKVVIIVVSMVIGVGSRFIWKKLRHDNPIEEIAEEIIKAKTGLDIDLTPSSPENKEKI